MSKKTMESPNEGIIERFFEAFSKHDMRAIREVMSDKVMWFFCGNNPFAGVRNGIQEVVRLFDQMASIMADSRPRIEKLIVASNDAHTIECQRIKIHRADGIHIDHHATVLWTFHNGKIIEGRHFWADPRAADKYFTAVAATLPL